MREFLNKPETQRIAALLSALLLCIVIFSGQKLRISYTEYEFLIPIIGIVFALGLVLMVLKSPGKNLKKLATTVLTIALTIAFCEAIIVSPIERVHFIKYGLLAIFLFFSQKRQVQKKSLIITLLLTSCLGAYEEALQMFDPERVHDPRDYVLNISAAISGTIISWCLSSTICTEK